MCVCVGRGGGRDREERTIKGVDNSGRKGGRDESRPMSSKEEWEDEGSSGRVPGAKAEIQRLKRYRESEGEMP